MGIATSRVRKSKKNCDMEVSSATIPFAETMISAISLKTKKFDNAANKRKVNGNPEKLYNENRAEKNCQARGNRDANILTIELLFILFPSSRNKYLYFRILRLPREIFLFAAIEDNNIQKQ